MEQGDYEKSAEGFKKACDIEPENRFFLSSYGHVLGEYLFDNDASLEMFKRAYEISPETNIGILNYAESLITDGQYARALPLIISVLDQAQSLRDVLYAKFLVLCCNAFRTNNIKELKDELTVLTYLLLDTNLKELYWVFNKFRLYIKKSTLKDEIKHILTIIMDHFDSDLSKSILFDEFNKI